MPDQVLIHPGYDRDVSTYAETWRGVTNDWRESSTGNHVWLTYSANYLFSCSGYKWALDPFSMSSRVTGLSAPDYQADLAGLSLVLLSHAHNDHLDRNLITALAEQDIQWVIPAYVMDKLKGEIALPADHVITPVPGEVIHAGPLELLPFDSLHVNGTRGVQETGYLVAFEEKRWLFPGDIRNHDFTALPVFGRLDVVFAHIWLGKACAMEQTPPLLDAFCEFFSRFETERLIISHFNEFGRDERELWRTSHFEMVNAEMIRRKPYLRIEQALTGDRIDLD